jgi:hypothetical protein
MLFLTVLLAVTSTCKLTNGDPIQDQFRILHDWKPFLFPIIDSRSSCYGYHEIFQTFTGSLGEFGLILVEDFTVSVIIITLFLLTYRPHDCFACLGKDPKRKYSKH